MPTLRFYLLGTLEIHHDGDRLPKPPTLKSQSLLAYLILHRQRSQPRDRLVELFWGDRPERKARGSLSTALWHIRRCLPGDCVDSDPQTVQFDPESDVWLDVEEFESCVSQDDITALQCAPHSLACEFCFHLLGFEFIEATSNCINRKTNQSAKYDIAPNPTTCRSCNGGVKWLITF